MNLRKIGLALIAAGSELADLQLELDGDKIKPSNSTKPQTVTVETEETEEEETSEASKMKVPELKQALLDKGFKEDDFKGMKKADLVQMLEQGIPLNAGEETEEESAEEITEDMFDAPAKSDKLPEIDEATLRGKMVEFAKATDKEKAFAMLAKFDGATAIAQLKPEQRAQCYQAIEAELAKNA